MGLAQKAEPCRVSAGISWRTCNSHMLLWEEIDAGLLCTNMLTRKLTPQDLVQNHRSEGRHSYLQGCLCWRCSGRDQGCASARLRQRCPSWGSPGTASCKARHSHDHKWSRHGFCSSQLVLLCAPKGWKF